jgi:hypothetical protein
VPFGVFTLAKSSKGFIFTKTSKSGPGTETSSLNKSMNNIAIVLAIYAQISSIAAAWLYKFKNLNAVTRNSLQKALCLKNAHKVYFKPKHPVK